MSVIKKRAEGQTAVTISLSAELLKRIDSLAQRDARKRSPYIVRLLEEYADDLVVRLPAELLARIDALAAADQRSRESWIAKVLISELDRTRNEHVAASPTKASFERITLNEDAPPEPTAPPKIGTPRRIIPALAKKDVRAQQGTGVVEVDLCEPAKGQPHPKSTRGIRRISGSK